MSVDAWGQLTLVEKAALAGRCVAGMPDHDTAHKVAAVWAGCHGGTA
jgi:hypothetical protein